jgi:hypothetical protein
MAKLFDSPRLTLIRAKHHIDDFKEDVNGFMLDSHKWTFAVDHDLQSGTDIYKIKFTRSLSENLPCILFDAVNNLRAVLDQAGYASAIAWGQRTDPKCTNFPFGGNDLTALDNNIDRRRVCKDLPPQIVTLFRQCKPHKGGNDILWSLNKLCNSKKHCALVPIEIANARANFKALFSNDVVRLGFGQIDGVWDSRKRELTLVTVDAGLNTNITGSFSFDIAIQGVEVQPRKTAVSNLNAMFNEVERILLATEAECRRLGFQLD